MIAGRADLWRREMVVDRRRIAPDAGTRGHGDAGTRRRGEGTTDSRPVRARGGKLGTLRGSATPPRKDPVVIHLTHFGLRKSYNMGEE